MGVKKVQLNIEKQRKGVIDIYLVSKVGNIHSNNLIIDEYPDKYEIVDISKQPMDLTYLSSGVYEFITSRYFDDSKKIVYKNSPITLKKDSPYPIVYQNLGPFFYVV